MTKKKYCVSVSPDVWATAKIKLGEPISQFLENQLILACQINNEKALIEQELATKEKEILALRSKLCQLEKQEAITLHKTSHIESCLPPIKRIVGRLGFVGKNKLYDIAECHENVELKDLLELCKEHNFKVIDQYEPSKDTGKIWDKRNF